MLGTFNEGLKLVPGIEEKLSNYSLYLDRHRILVFNYKIASLYFGAGNYSVAIDYLQKIMNVAGNNMLPDSSSADMLNASRKMWKNAIVTGGDTKGGALAFHGEVNLVDQESNSLLQLNQYIDQLFQMNEKRMKNMPAGRNLDSLLTPPPMDTVNVP